ncbi:3-isopropylmalate dehydratase small subunit [Paraburkholderia elongata]|uniref:3-isopropylmalate dehydratase n=1 Tax=Paraburkholderia elongata TaxID=2675747 RepID=A0A972SKY7_9BURK|nr:3-isopropylmalate dehydratase small subunit [Paraburkholderia elongata]NPT55080.1 3-isopropylmalate dehydratase small subunit [Paraburkholderia elongata]
MQPFEAMRARAALLLMDDVGADNIISVSGLMKTSKTGFADAMFASWRYLPDGTENPEFSLNHARYKNAQILIAGRNFGYGSSREAAVWALRDYGFRCLIARSFGPIFYGNCIKNGLLPIALDDQSHAALVDQLNRSENVLNVSLENFEISTDSGATFSFRLPKVHQRLLLEGMEAIDYVNTFLDQIHAYRAVDRIRRPWVYLNTNKREVAGE